MSFEVLFSTEIKEKHLLFDLKLTSVAFMNNLGKVRINSGCTALLLVYHPKLILYLVRVFYFTASQCRSVLQNSIAVT